MKRGILVLVKRPDNVLRLAAADEDWANARKAKVGYR